MTDPIGTAQERELIEAVLEQSDDEIAFEELHRIYNFTDDDTKQFTRWQMIVAYRHGFRLGKELINEPNKATADALQSRIAEVGELRDALVDARAVLAHGSSQSARFLLGKIDAALSLQRRV